jgi:hypothetical protein
MPLPFIVKNRPTTGTKCVACNNFRTAEQLRPCVCGSPICDCGIPCPDCTELLATYDVSMARYKARHIHLVCETIFPNFMRRAVSAADEAELLRVFKHHGLLN